MPSQTNSYLTTLTPLRGIAAFFVLLFHSNLLLEAFVPPRYNQFIISGGLWVDFFFVLSGFIMSYVYSASFANGVTIVNFKRYIAARFGRVYPLYFFSTLWAFISVLFSIHFATKISLFMSEIFNIKALPACLLLIQSMNVGYFLAPLNSAGWSLSTEWWAYVLFPFIVPFFLKLKNKGIFLTYLIIILFYTSICLFLGSHSLSRITTYFGFLRCLAGFFSGMLLFLLYRRKAGYSVFKHDSFFVIVSVLLLTAMQLRLMDAVIVVFFPFIIISASYNDGKVKGFLDLKVLQRLGDWSFSIYMVQIPIIWTFYIFRVKENSDYLSESTILMANSSGKPDYFHGLFMLFLLLALTLMISALSYRFIEIPARNYLNKIFKIKY